MNSSELERGPPAEVVLGSSPRPCASLTPEAGELLRQHLSELDARALTLTKIRGDAVKLRAVQSLLDVFAPELQANQREVLERALGLRGLAEGLEPVARDLGVTRERAGQIAKQALRRLVKKSRAYLGDGVDDGGDDGGDKPLPGAAGLTLERYQGTPTERALALARLPEEALRRLAVKAAHERDEAALWNLTSAHLLLFGAKGSRVSKRTQENYRRGLKDLLLDWDKENLIRPSRNAGVEWVRNIETRVVLNPVTGEPKLDGRTGAVKTLAPATVALKLAAARALYRALRWSGATTASPFADVKPVKDAVKPWSKRGAYSQEELERLLEHAQGADKVMVLLGAHAGLRVAEMSELRWADLDFPASQLTVVEGKGGKTDAVFMSDRLITALKDLPRGLPSDPILPYRAYRARERFRKLCLLANVTYKGKEVHGLRHAAGTRAHEVFNDLARVADHLRQEDANTARRYAKRADQKLKKGVKEF